MKLLNHVLLNTSSFVEHILSHVECLPSVWDFDHPKNEALIVSLIGDLSILLALKSIENLRDTERGYTKLNCELTD